MGLRPSSFPRRGFVGRLASVLASTVAGVGALGAARPLQAAPSEPPATPPQPAPRTPPRHPQDAWMDTLPTAHRLVLDATSATGAVDAVMFGWNFLRTSSGAYGLGDADHGLILVLRHGAMVMALPQPLWTKYPALVPPPFTNGFADAPARESLLRPGAPTRIPDAFLLDALAKRGVHFAICQTALERNAGTVARAMSLDAKALIAEFTAALPTNAHVMPSGITAVQRAQEYGFSHAHAG